MKGDVKSFLTRAVEADKAQRRMRKEVIGWARELLDLNEDLRDAVDKIDDKFTFKLLNYPGDLSYRRIVATIEGAFKCLTK